MISQRIMANGGSNDTEPAFLVKESNGILKAQYTSELMHGNRQRRHFDAVRMPSCLVEGRRARVKDVI